MDKEFYIGSYVNLIHKYPGQEPILPTKPSPYESLIERVYEFDFDDIKFSELLEKIEEIKSKYNTENLYVTNNCEELLVFRKSNKEKDKEKYQIELDHYNWQLKNYERTKAKYDKDKKEFDQHNEIVDFLFALYSVIKKDPEKMMGLAKLYAHP